MDFTNWTNYLTSTQNGMAVASGASGIEAFGSGDFLEGNIFGTDPTGTTAMGNRQGVFCDNGPAFGNMSGGNVIGGTTPQARNLNSGNTFFNIGLLSICYEGQVTGNYVGTNLAGTTYIAAGATGVSSNGPTIVIGGTLPGDGNLISGNYVDVDFNDVTNGNAAMNSTAQGNLLGTDATGTKAILNPNQSELGRRDRP